MNNILYLVCFKKDGIEYIYHSDKKFYCAYVCDDKTQTMYYKRLNNAMKIAKRYVGGYVKTIDINDED